MRLLLSLCFILITLSSFAQKQDPFVKFAEKNPPMILDIKKSIHQDFIIEYAAKKTSTIYLTIFRNNKKCGTGHAVVRSKSKGIAEITVHMSKGIHLRPALNYEYRLNFYEGKPKDFRKKITKTTIISNLVIKRML